MKYIPSATCCNAYTYKTIGKNKSQKDIFLAHDTPCIIPGHPDVRYQRQVITMIVTVKYDNHCDFVC